jgi:hypothetical protein
MEEELEILKKLFRGTLQETELLDIYFQFRNKYRVLVSLLQQPRFPEKYALNIIPKLYPIDLVKVVKNKRTNPNTRKRVEQEFTGKYIRFPLGEKLSYLRIAPDTMLEYFIEESDERVITAILQNPFSTEELILKFLNRKTDKYPFYEALSKTEWYKRPQVAEAISNDLNAPIKILVMILPYLNLRQLERLFKNENTHQVVKRNIIHYLENR